MEFKTLSTYIQAQFDKMCKKGKLFRVEMTGREIWNLYLDSFKPENNQKFRDPASSEHNCNTCNSFIRRYGNVVSVNDDGKLESIFSNLPEDLGEYTDSIIAVEKAITASKIKDIFFETFESLNGLPYESCKRAQSNFQLGIPSNLKKYTSEEVELYGVVNSEDIYEFHHFNLKCPKEFVLFSDKSLESITAKHRDKYNVFKRAMEELPLDTLTLVKDLINQGSLLDGTAHLKALTFAKASKELYDATTWDKDNWVWVYSTNIHESQAKFKNTLIGVLCTELAEGVELNKACLNWNKRVDPANYHKATAPITKKQIEDAQKFVEENGYTESFDRKFATIDDIKVNEILHSNVGDGEIKSVSMFDSIKSTSTRHKKSEFSKVEEVPIEKFMKDILPSCTSIEAYVENRMEGNMVTLTKASSDDSKRIFKWHNNYSWTFNGNLAGKSQIKEAVKTAGGAVDGVLRFSIMWAENNGDNSDLDAHCIEPSGNTIYYGKRMSMISGGTLDIDITSPKNQMPNGAVENITFPDITRMKDGVYTFRIHQFSARASKGFKAEIAFGSEIFNYEYTNPIPYKKYVDVACVTLKDGTFSIKHKLPETSSSKEIWGLDTNEFHKVNLVCLSPNHWGEDSVGNKHFMFMLDKCASDTDVRSFHNENLTEDLLKHRKVLEVLGNTNMISPNGVKQLAGLGFNSTVRDELIVKIQGTHKRMIKLKF